MTTKNTIPCIPKSDPSDKSVNTLESLVPPLDLCKQIPAGAFEDSVLVWFGVKNYDSTMEVVPRLELGETCKVFLKKGIRVLYPAPTLQEIMLAIDESGGYCPSCRYQANTWQLDYEDDPLSDESMLPVLVDESDRYNPATAALKLWLELNKEGGEQ